MKLTEQLLEEYERNGWSMGWEQQVREKFEIPESQYFSIQLFPTSAKGTIHLRKYTRVVKAKKISKSDQS